MADSDNDTDAKETRAVKSARPSLLEPIAQLRVFKDEFREDANHSSKWRTTAKEEFGFLAGDQWTPDEKAQLKDQLRPEIVFNRSITLIKAVAGFEINGRHEIQFLPRTLDDAAINDVLTGASKWMADECDGEDEESEAFQDTLVTGMGWCLSDDAMVRLPTTHFATTRSYTGAVIKIDLENGKQLTGTPNHPILTDMGWKRLCDIHEGDNLVNSSILERIDGLPVEQFDKVETRLKDKIDAFRAGREALRFATAPNDFYADGAGSKVHVVYADSLLLDKVRHLALVQKVKKAGFVRRGLLSVRRAALFAKSLIDRALHAAVGQPAFNAVHLPSAHLPSNNVVSEGMPRSAQAYLNAAGRAAGLDTNLGGTELLFKIKALNFLNRHAGFLSTIFGARDESRSHQPHIDAAGANAKFLSDFLDWKPVLKIEACKLRSRDGEFSKFVTRVKSRIVSYASALDVHDVGTSIGFFIAGDIITSNCENRMDWELNSQGMYVEDHVDPLEMYWDRNARKKNLTDARRIERLKKMTLADAMSLFPDADPEDLDASWAVGDTPDDSGKTIEQKRIRDENSEPQESDEVHILERQWWERVPMWLVADEATNKKIEMTEAEYATLTKRLKMLGLGKLTAVKIHKRKFYRAFIGAKVLECGDGPLPDRFSYACITGQLDKNKGIWFGLIRIMRDPQKWANKWLSQTLHIMNSQAKGGIFVEPGFFDDQRGGEESYPKPESMTFVTKGALGDAATGKSAKWAPKPVANFPAGFYQLLEFAISSLRDIPGINLELLGQKDINQPGVLEAQRKQAGMTVLATMFDSLRRFRKLTGRIRLYYIQTFLSDGRLIRITGPEGAKVIPLIRDKCLGEFDVVVDDTPTSPNQKQANWAVIAPMIPMFKDQLTSNPPLLIELMRYSPLPDRLVSAFETLINKPPTPDADQAKKLAIAGQVAIINKNQSTAEMQNAKAGATQATAAYDIAMARNLMEKNDLAGLKTHLDNMHTAAQIQTEQAKAGQIAADTAHTAADTHATHADAAHTAVKMLIDAATPIPNSAPAQAA